MAFQFRRGTDAQRSTITPAEGEPLYATDTHALYVGDGTTMGGIQITGGGGGSTSTLVNGSYTAQLNSQGQLNTDQYLAREGGPGTNPPDGNYAGYSFQGDGGYDTGMFSNGDGELQWYGNGIEVFSTTPNYFQLHKYIDMNGQDITSLNQITFGDSTVQTTAYTINTDQALYTTSSVQFQNLALGVGNITSDNALNLTAPYIGIVSTSTYDIDLYTNNFTADGVEVWLRHNDGVEINTANAVYNWKFTNTGTMRFPDSSVQITAWTGTSHILSNGTATVTLNSNSSLELSPNTYISFDPPNPEGQVFYIGILPGGDESATTSSFIYTSGEADFNITVNGNIWFFDRAGNLTLPNGGIITDSNDYNEGLVIKASTANNDPIHLETNSTNTWTFALDGSLTLPGDINTNNIIIADGHVIYASHGAYGVPDSSFTNVRIGLYGNNPAYAIGVETNHSWIQGQSGVKLYSGDNVARLTVEDTGVTINNAYTLPQDSGSTGSVLTSNGDGTTVWANNGQTTIYARNALPSGIPGMIITISDSGSDTNSPSGNWAPAYWDNDAGLWTYIGNSNSVIAD